MDNKPNVLLIATDHWPAQLLGCAGHPVIMTPTLDSMAKNGVRFTNFYSECPVCIPARRSLMTGLSPKTHGDRVYSDRMEMPDVPTLAGCFGNAGYQTFAVGKLHVYPQRNRIGFDDVILQEEGRYDFGCVDDYQIWLGENGYTGQEFLHAMGNNIYYTRPWHLPEEAHPTTWATREMMRQIKRKDPTRPAFYYMSYQFPHPPLVPLQVYLDMYDMDEIDEPYIGDWADDSDILHIMQEPERAYSRKEMRMARRAFYAQCTHIDHEIRLLIGTLRECNLLDNTIIMFISDHGDMLFNHNLVAKRCFYENSANIPLIVTGKPIQDKCGKVTDKLACMKDIMPTLLDLCGIDIPDTVEGIPLFSEKKNPYIFGEIGEGIKATRMICDGTCKYIYYPYGNEKQLFDIRTDPHEMHNLAHSAKYKEQVRKAEQELMKEMHGGDLEWIDKKKLKGMQKTVQVPKKDFGLYNQRGYHWPPPSGYSNIGKNN